MPRRVRITGTKGRRSISRLNRLRGQAPKTFMRGRMPKFTLEVFGDKKLIKIFNRLVKNTESATFKAMTAAVKIVSKEAHRIVTTGPYKAVDTGKLSKSIRGLVEKFVLGKYIYGSAGVFDVLYAIYVHEGTKNMEARPFLILALRNKEGVIIKLITQAIQKDIKKGWA